jgi:hypothetical protein
MLTLFDRYNPNVSDNAKEIEGVYIPRGTDLRGFSASPITTPIWKITA